jgi:hypothetical protein
MEEFRWRVMITMAIGKVSYAAQNLKTKWRFKSIRFKPYRCRIEKS